MVVLKRHATRVQLFNKHNVALSKPELIDAVVVQKGGHELVRGSEDFEA